MRLLLIGCLVLTGCQGTIDVDGGLAPVDAGTTDAGAPVDAGTPDAGTPFDAGAPDAGNDAGAPDAGTPDAGTPDAGPADAGLNPVFVAVGYNGFRIRSTDLGLTWKDEKTAGTSGDNEFLIRGVGFGNGVFVAARGYPSGKVRVSEDGANWTEHNAPTDQWMADIVFIGGKFIAIGGSGVVWSSVDGKTWTSKSGAFGGNHMRTVVVGGNTLMAAGSAGWYRSDDQGTTWTFDSAHTMSNEIKIAYCGTTFQEVSSANLGACANFTRARGAIHAEGVWLRANNSNIQRSLDGGAWTTVYTGTRGIEDLELGYVP